MIQMDELIETAELSAFARTVDAGSLSRAATELGVPRATIGRRLARLEERLGARLLRRTTRNLVLTDEGRALYDQAKIALGAVRDAMLSVRRSDGAIRGRLRVSAPPLPGKAFHALVTGFLARHPEVRLELSFSTGAVDFGEDGFDLAIRASQTLDLGLVRRPISESRLIAVASPEYLARRGVPARAEDLSGHACILGYARGEAPRREWPLRLGGTVRVGGPLVTNELRLALDAARAGLGIALLPEPLTRDAIAAGELVRILEADIDAAVHLSVVLPERHLLRPVVRAFVEEVVVWGKRELPREECRGIIDASALTIPARGLANGEPGAHDERRIRTEGHPMGDKNPKQKSRQDAQKQSDKNAKAAKTKASAPVAAPKGAKK